MQPLAPYPDVEAALLLRLDSLDATVGTYIPSDLKDRMPFLFVYRFAGSDNGIEDRAVVGIDIFSATRGQGLPLAESVRQLVTATPYAVGDGVVIDRVATSEAPHEVPYGDSAIRRWVSSYDVTLRR